MKTAAIILIVTATSLSAVENVSKGGFAPPKKYGLERYEAEWSRNPFSVPTPPTAPVAAVSAFKDMAIAAIYGRKDNPTIQVVNIATKKRTRLSLDKPNEGISLKSFSIMPSRKDTTIEVTMGTETATLHYDETYMKGAADGQARAPGAIGAAGGNMNAGVPRIPLPGSMPNNPTATTNRNIPPVNTRQILPNQNIPNNAMNSNAPRVYGAPATNSGQIGTSIPVPTSGGNLTLTAPTTGGSGTVTFSGNNGGTSTTITVGSGTNNVPATPGAVAPGTSNRRRTLISVPQGQ